MPEDAGRRFAELRPHLLRRAPVQYLLGEWDFFGRTFFVDDRALIPRPETEHLVEEALGRARSSRHLLDIGCGSGVLAITLALECPSARVLGVDASAAALALSRKNARRWEVLGRTQFLASDWLTAVSAQGRFDLAVANPPYVALGDRETLPAGVRDFEPELALFAGDDGLSEIRRLLEMLPAHLRPGSPFLFEFGFGQRDALATELRAHRQWKLERFVDDLAGIPRVAVLTRSAPRRSILPSPCR